MCSTNRLHLPFCKGAAVELQWVRKVSQASTQDMQIVELGFHRSIELNIVFGILGLH